MDRKRREKKVYVRIFVRFAAAWYTIWQLALLMLFILFGNQVAICFHRCSSCQIFSPVLPHSLFQHSSSLASRRHLRRCACACVLLTPQLALPPDFRGFLDRECVCVSPLFFPEEVSYIFFLIVCKVHIRTRMINVCMCWVFFPFLHQE